MKHYRLYIKVKDIQVLEGCCYVTAFRVLQKIKEFAQTQTPTIRNYAEFRQQKEEYIIEKMQEFKLI